MMDGDERERRRKLNDLIDRAMACVDFELVAIREAQLAMSDDPVDQSESNRKWRRTIGAENLKTWAGAIANLCQARSQLGAWSALLGGEDVGHEPRGRS